MNTIKVPLHLLLIDARCDSILFTVEEVNAMFEELIKPMLEENRSAEDIGAAFHAITETVRETISGVSPVHLPPIELSGISVDIPVDQIQADDFERLQKKINIAKEAIKEWESRQDISAKGRKTE